MKANRKSIITKNHIESTFLELLKTQPLSKIGVKEIATAAKINRNTFYYYYKNIPDLIESIVKNFVDTTLKDHSPAYHSYEDCLLVAIDFAKENRESIYHIYDSTNRAIFERYLWKICDYTVNSYINSFPVNPLKPTQFEIDLLIEILKFECFGFVMDWIMKGMPEDVTTKIKLLSASIKNQVKYLPNY